MLKPGIEKKSEPINQTGYSTLWDGLSLPSSSMKSKG